jgi:hypothetical protein
MLHEAIEAVHAPDAVMDGVESPEQRCTVAGVVGQRDSGIEDQEREEGLREEGPFAGP